MEYASGKRYAGEETVDPGPDAKGRSDLPLFVREGTILASE